MLFSCGPPYGVQNCTAWQVNYGQEKINSAQCPEYKLFYSPRFVIRAAEFISERDGSSIYVCKQLRRWTDTQMCTNAEGLHKQTDLLKTVLKLKLFYGYFIFRKRSPWGSSLWCFKTKEKFICTHQCIFLTAKDQFEDVLQLLAAKMFKHDTKKEGPGFWRPTFSFEAAQISAESKLRMLFSVRTRSHTRYFLPLPQPFFRGRLFLKLDSASFRGSYS